MTDKDSKGDKDPRTPTGRARERKLIEGYSPPPRPPKEQNSEKGDQSR